MVDRDASSMSLDGSTNPHFINPAYKRKKKSRRQWQEKEEETCHTRTPRTSEPDKKPSKSFSVRDKRGLPLRVRILNNVLFSSISQLSPFARSLAYTHARTHNTVVLMSLFSEEGFVRFWPLMARLRGSSSRVSPRSLSRLAVSTRNGAYRDSWRRYAKKLRCPLFRAIETIPVVERPYPRRIFARDRKAKEVLQRVDFNLYYTCDDCQRTRIMRSRYISNYD